MGNKVILISIDGMRPDGLMKCNNSYDDVLKEKASYKPDTRTVFPSITLPCRVSMFHRIPPERHGTTTNLYGPQFVPGKELSGVSILDIAPTIADIMGVSPAKEWEGKSLVCDMNK